jgi:hypothetical protein
MRKALEQAKGKWVTVIFDKNHRIKGKILDVYEGSFKFRIRELFEGETDTFVAIDKVRYFHHGAEEGDD